MNSIGQCVTYADAKAEAASLYFSLAVDLLTDLFSTSFLSCLSSIDLSL
jgi:hypothetical protein